jgi:hypothetical protein
MKSIDFEFEVGEEVFDDLTGQKAKIICVQYKNGARKEELSIACHTVGYWVDNDYLGGGRESWELTKLKI